MILFPFYPPITKRLVMISSQDVYRAYGVARRADNGSLEPLPISVDSAVRNNRYPYNDPGKNSDDCAIYI